MSGAKLETRFQALVAGLRSSGTEAIPLPDALTLQKFLSEVF